MVNSALNTVKFIAAMFVIFIHIQFPDNFGIAVNSIARFAVPFFFMVSGYYCYYENIEVQYKKLINKIKKMFGFICIYNLLYFLLRIINNIFNHNNIIDFLSEMISSKSIFNFIIFNESPVWWHLWFLNALLYCYIIFMLFNKIKFDKRIYILIPVLLCFNFFLGEIYTSIKIIPNYYYRNFLFIGLPYMLLGYLFHLNKDKIISKFSSSSCYIFIVVFIIATLLERNLLNDNKEHYLSTIFLTIFIFLICMLKPYKFKNSIISDIGHRYTLMIYIIHPLIIYVYQIIIQRYNLINRFAYGVPIMVCILSVLSVHVYYKIREGIHNKVLKIAD